MYLAVKISEKGTPLMIEFCQEVYSVMGSKYLSGYPPTQEKLDEIIAGFNEMGFPQCYGAIDGCHIEVAPPKEDAMDYYNFKGWYPFILFASADHKCRFTYINVGATGRNNKCTNRNHYFPQIKKNIDGVDVPVILLGDSSFRLWNVVPNQDPAEKLFNYRLSKCRRVVENTFGELKARFRKIGRGLEVDVNNAYIIV